jgi:hypothetical protein
MPPNRPASNEFGDCDYRNQSSPSMITRYNDHSVSINDGSNINGCLSQPSSSRRRRRRSISPLINDDDTIPIGRHRRSKRQRHDSPMRNNKMTRTSRWGERPSICKFFREGYCRDVST